jgi:hypothetical protein
MMFEKLAVDLTAAFELHREALIKIRPAEMSEETWLQMIEDHLDKAIRVYAGCFFLAHLIADIHAPMLMSLMDKTLTKTLHQFSKEYVTQVEDPKGGECESCDAPCCIMHPDNPILPPDLKFNAHTLGDADHAVADLLRRAGITPESEKS